MNSKKDLLTWLHQTLDVPITKIEDLGRGIHYNLLFYNLDHQYPLRLLNKNAKTEPEYLKNLKICQEYMTRQNIVAHFPINRICKCKLQDNLEFVQWLYRYYESRKIQSMQNTQMRNIKEVQNKVTNTTQDMKTMNHAENNYLFGTRSNAVIFGKTSNEYKPNVMVNMEKKTERENNFVAQYNMNKNAYNVIENKNTLYRKDENKSSNPEVVYKKENPLDKILNEYESNVNNTYKITENQNKCNKINDTINSSNVSSFCRMTDNECKDCKKIGDKLKNYISNQFYLNEKVKYYDKKMAEIESLENNTKLLVQNVQMLEKQCAMYENMIKEQKNEHNSKIETLSNYIEKFQAERDFYFSKIKELENEIRKGESNEKLLEVLYRK